MSILLAVFTDGRRDCIAETIPSALANLSGLSGTGLIFDDSGDPVYREWLRRSFAIDNFHVISPPVRRGFARNIRDAWRTLSGDFFAQFDYVWHAEDDVTYNRPVDVAAMVDVLRIRSHLHQMALRRQPWNDSEREAGGIIEQHPDDYAEIRDGEQVWLQHRRHFTTQPSLYRRSLCARGWPTGPESEGRFGIELFRDPAAKCGYWGARDSGEWVTHIGRDRVGTGY